MTVLVGGGAGYIGSHTVVSLCEAGHEVVVVDNFVNSSPKAIDAASRIVGHEITLVEADLCDRRTIGEVIKRHNITDVVHFGAHKAVGESVDEPLKYYRNNLCAVLGTIEAMVDQGVERLVFSSSCAVYGQPETLPVVETVPLAPTSPYGRTKLMAEQIIGDVCAKGDIGAISLRYFNPIGAHPSGLIGEDNRGQATNLVPAVLQVASGHRDCVEVFGDNYQTPDGTGVRDFIHVVDLAEAHLSALDALRQWQKTGASFGLMEHGQARQAQLSEEIDGGLSGQTAINVGAGRGFSVLEVIRAAEDACKKRIPIQVRERRPGDVAQIWASTELAKRMLGWQVQRGLDEMLEDHWRWHSQNPNGY